MLHYFLPFLEKNGFEVARAECSADCSFEKLVFTLNKSEFMKVIFTFVIRHNKETHSSASAYYNCSCYATDNYEIIENATLQISYKQIRATSQTWVYYLERTHIYNKQIEHFFEKSFDTTREPERNCWAVENNLSKRVELDFNNDLYNDAQEYMNHLYEEMCAFIFEFAKNYSEIMGIPCEEEPPSIQNNRDLCIRSYHQSLEQGVSDVAPEKRKRYIEYDECDELRAKEQVC